MIRAEEEWNSAAKKNYTRLRERWPQFVEKALIAINDLISEYQHQEYGPEPQSDVFVLEIPAEPISDECDWSFSVESDPGWVIDLQGWEVVGGEGVF